MATSIPVSIFEAIVSSMLSRSICVHVFDVKYKLLVLMFSRDKNCECNVIFYSPPWYNFIINCATHPVSISHHQIQCDIYVHCTMYHFYFDFIFIFSVLCFQVLLFFLLHFVFYDSSLVSSMYTIQRNHLSCVSIWNETTTNSSIYYVVFVFICLVFSIISSQSFSYSILINSY